VTSRSSTYTTSSGESNGKLSQRSRSTAATSVSNLTDDDQAGGSTLRRPKHLIHRKSPGHISEPERERPTSRLSQSYSRPETPEPEGYVEMDEDQVPTARGRSAMDSGYDLSARLELARQNSRQQPEFLPPPEESLVYPPPEESMYDGKHKTWFH
jgi:hypothetical protein